MSDKRQRKGTNTNRQYGCPRNSAGDHLKQREAIVVGNTGSFRKAGKEWVEEANKKNVTRMMHDNAISNEEQPLPQSEPLPVHEQEET